ncbi:hypothetical protein KSD_21970 [Ktedonobacter sp. SOSP1-85]|nr:hypothetical protein KSD_21970 [Ktedonobacter sp. SOSP1-85]
MNSTVPCLPSYNKVAIERGGGWVCYGNSSGFATVGWDSGELRSDSWSGYITFLNRSPVYFCDHQDLKLAYLYVDQIYLSPTRASWC